jgi:hypothetical protein
LVTTTNRRRFLKAACATAFLAKTGGANPEIAGSLSHFPRPLDLFSLREGGDFDAGERAAAVPWSHYARIAGFGLRLDRIDQIVEDATESHVFGIETDNDITGRYESFLDPTEKLKAIQAVAAKGTPPAIMRSFISPAWNASPPMPTRRSTHFSKTILTGFSAT